METEKGLGQLDLAALICSKVCHDLVNPVGAMMNGLEFLDDDDAGDMREDALDLIRKSVVLASSRLKFARLAFGAGGSAGAMLVLGELRQIAEDYVTTDRLRLVWQAPDGEVGKDQAKLLLNLVVIGQSTIPRGGTLSVVVDGDLATPRFSIRGEGRAARINGDLAGLFDGRTEPAELSASNVQPYFAGMVARSVGAEVSFAMQGDDAVLIEARIGS